MSKKIPNISPGTVIGNRYEVIKNLGSGSMGYVLLCKHRELAGHTVAVKVLFPEVAEDEVSAARFKNEIFASYGVSHPNVVRAYEYFRDGDLLGYSMEHVQGKDLSDLIRDKKNKLSVQEVLKIVSQICSGLQAIHDAGIVHRDMKPENILINKENQVKIADFGIAKSNDGPKLTEHGGVVGTIDYVSPEYMLDSIVDWRSDIYALGIISYELLTKLSPFEGDTVYETMNKRLSQDPAAPSSINNQVPKELDNIILKMLARKPEDRFQSALEIFRELSPLIKDDIRDIQSTFQSTALRSPVYKTSNVETNSKPTQEVDISNILDDYKEKDTLTITEDEKEFILNPNFVERPEMEAVLSRPKLSKKLISQNIVTNSEIIKNYSKIRRTPLFQTFFFKLIVISLSILLGTLSSYYLFSFLFPEIDYKNLTINNFKYIQGLIKTFI